MLTTSLLPTPGQDAIGLERHPDAGTDTGFCASVTSGSLSSGKSESWDTDAERCLSRNRAGLRFCMAGGSADFMPNGDARRFSISVTRPDGSFEHYHRVGGSSMDHTSEALERAGLGGVVRVLAVEPGDAA